MTDEKNKCLLDSCSSIARWHLITPMRKYPNSKVCRAHYCLVHIETMKPQFRSQNWVRKAPKHSHEHLEEMSSRLLQRKRTTEEVCKESFRKAVEELEDFQFDKTAKHICINKKKFEAWKKKWNL